mmetsp:Transcript_9377/g.15295  ORF Transcript_9377/g.15295 Transcript_9377/m.15295 type:complete len:278 (+) Transcript_9377:418-1251(+)
MDIEEGSRQSVMSCGLVAGTIHATVFSPVDRALFLANVNKRPLLVRSNFVKPFQGLNQVVCQKTLTGGMCFPLEDFLRRYCPVGEQDSLLRNFVAGTLTGSIIAIAANPLSTVTYQSWGNHHKGNVLQVAHKMWKQAGLTSFKNGLGITLCRDFFWGGVYSCVRHEIPKLFVAEGDKNDGVSFVSNVFAAGLATTITAPLNYLRNLEYGQSLDGAKRLDKLEALKELWSDARVVHAKNGTNRLNYLASRMTIGWGTLRVSLGLAFSCQVYEFLRDQY